MHRKLLILVISLYIMSLISMGTSIYLAISKEKVIFAVLGMPITVSFSVTAVTITVLSSRKKIERS
jgi:hypothetical protein